MNYVLRLVWWFCSLSEKDRCSCVYQIRASALVSCVLFVCLGALCAVTMSGDDGQVEAAAAGDAGSVQSHGAEEQPSREYLFVAASPYVASTLLDSPAKWARVSAVDQAALEPWDFLLVSGGGSGRSGDGHDSG